MASRNLNPGFVKKARSSAKSALAKAETAMALAMMLGKCAECGMEEVDGRCPACTSLLEVAATDGTKFTVAVPNSLPTEDRAKRLRWLFSKYAHLLDSDWRGRVEAIVTADMADDMADAMNFMGAKVDSRTALSNGAVKLTSRGYWAHGY
jgi:hypothetical protein